MSNISYGMFNESSCLESSFSINITHKAWPFGLFENILKVNKSECIFDIYFERYKYLKTSWKVDVCRSPIHIKTGLGGIDVIKKEGKGCPASSSSPFCKEWKKISTVLQDDGLIFAEGAKEELGTDHGKVYCSFLLLEGYLPNGNVLSAHTQNYLWNKAPVKAEVAPVSNPAIDLEVDKKIPSTGGDGSW
jgi:hypothetical protein